MDAKTAKPLQASQAVMIRHPALPVRLDADSDRALASSDPDVLTAYLRSVYDDPYCRAAHEACQAPPRCDINGQISQSDDYPSDPLRTLRRGR